VWDHIVGLYKIVVSIGNAKMTPIMEHGLSWGPASPTYLGILKNQMMYALSFSAHFYSSVFLVIHVTGNLR
jgi:hypothetical protein